MKQNPSINILISNDINYVIIKVMKPTKKVIQANKG
jgi:hypothetical protein